MYRSTLASPIQAKVGQVLAETVIHGALIPPPNLIALVQYAGH